VADPCCNACCNELGHTFRLKRKDKFNALEKNSRSKKRERRKRTELGLT
jgi:hypothetical protein